MKMFNKSGTVNDEAIATLLSQSAYHGRQRRIYNDA